MRGGGCTQTVLRVVLLAALSAVLASSIGGCARRLRVREPRGPLKIQAIAPRVDVVLGHTAVIPVTVEGAIRSGRPLTARMDNGKTVNAELHWVSVLPDAGEPVAGWLPPAGRWSATPATSSSRPSASGFWVVTADLPMPDVGQGLHVAGERIALNWLPDPTLIKPQDDEGPWRPPYPGRVDEGLLRIAEVDSRSPARRWRSRLLTDGLAPGAYRGADAAGAAAVAFPNPVLEAFAVQTEARWQVAIAMLWAANPELADRVKRRLVAVVDFGEGTLVPAWGVDEDELDSLLNDLLNQRHSGAQRVDRAAAWLETQPAGTAWVVDDAGVVDAATGRAIVTCGVANLGDRATLAWAVPGQSGATPELSPVPPQTAVQIAVTTSGAEREAGGTERGPQRAAAVPVMVHSGRWSARLSAAAEAIPAAPPGVRIEPFLGDWTLAGWRAGAIDAAMGGEVDWATAALLLRDEGSSGAKWSVYLECKSPQEQSGGVGGSGGADTARIWLGPRGHPTAVIRVSRDGTVSEEMGSGQEADLRGVKVSVVGGKWSVRVPVPARCVEVDGTLRIGVDRVDSRGRRSAWPRPMLPWQSEPGRLAVNTRAWKTVGEPTPAATRR